MKLGNEKNMSKQALKPLQISQQLKNTPKAS